MKLVFDDQARQPIKSETDDLVKFVKSELLNVVQSKLEEESECLKEIPTWLPADASVLPNDL